MKAYGKDRYAHSHRKVSFTRKGCPCCTPTSSWRKRGTKSYKKRARQSGKFSPRHVDVT